MTEPETRRCDDGRQSSDGKRTLSDAKLHLMLEEYRALRAESVARMSSRNNLTGLLAASLALILSREQPIPNLIAVVAAVGAIAFVCVWSLMLLARLRDHLETLEGRINSEATRVYNCDGPVLTWEGSSRGQADMSQADGTAGGFRSHFYRPTIRR
jgi:hypothetical protein